MKTRALAGLFTFAAVVFSSSAALAYGESDANGFPNWSERVLLEWTNRARCDPQADLTGCTSCGDKACYSPVAPYAYSANLNHSSRFHSAESIKQNYGCLDHYSHCNVVSNIASIYPATCDGSASCACTGGTDVCASGTCPCASPPLASGGTSPSARVALFGTDMMFEGIASYTDPNSAFYQWLDEPYSGSSCEYDQGPPTNGHRFQLIKGEYSGQNATVAGFGVVDGSVSVVDEGIESTTNKIPSGSHYPRQSSSVDVWANWVDTVGPKSALVNVDGECTALHLGRGAVTNGAYTANLTSVGSGCHRYFFVFSDSSSAVVTYPETGSLGIGPEGSCLDFDPATRPTAGASCNCTPQCSGKACGDDGCGGGCGNCTGSQTCNASGQCIGGGGGGSGDGGGGVGGGGTGGDGGVGAGGGSGSGGDANGDSPSEDSGCGCSIVGKSSGNDALLAIFALSGVLAIARRRR
ncbi:MAG: hypothetical protein ACRELY_08195 [Polyangiaceae bacterium]